MELTSPTGKAPPGKEFNMPTPGVCLTILSDRHRKAGLGTPSNPVRFLNQDYQTLKQFCLIRRVRFIDEMFPPDRTSIGQGVLKPEDLERVIWQRPGVLVPNPHLVVDGISRFDFGQGVLGNCWLLASIGALTFQKIILENVVPLDQRFDVDYCGLFHFRFWRFGKWVDVVIDDKLPTIDGKLIFVHAKEPTEFWPALFEKAYAKVCGSYADMVAGTPAEAMVDFTGGVHLHINLQERPSNLWEMMFRAGKVTSLMGCGTPQGETAANTVLENGLVQGHAYTITGVKQLLSQGQLASLVRLWNPWGRVEWKGSWSDRSNLWQTVAPEERNLCLSVADDGEFWMDMDDFCKNFNNLDICSLCPEFIDGGSKSQWIPSIHEGRWVAGTTAGGCMNSPDTFWTNPQYRVTITRLTDECVERQDEKNMLVSLMQKPDKRHRSLVENLHIGFCIFEVPPEHKMAKGKFSPSFFAQNVPIFQLSPYLNARGVMHLLSVKPGDYLIVPSTFSPNETASFILTILTKAEILVNENSDNSHIYEQIHPDEPDLSENFEDDEVKRKFFRQFSDKYEEVDDVQLQMMLNGHILKGDLKSGGFSLDACRGMIALMDSSVTGRLNANEFVELWEKIITFRDIFNLTDVSRSGTLSLKELRQAIVATGIKVRDEMLNLMALRYGASSGHMTLENFICLVLRFNVMNAIFKQLSDGKSLTLQKSEWLCLTMYN
ncbi:calpain-1 catalytic subunit-like [Synchiropus picturatus]